MMPLFIQKYNSRQQMYDNYSSVAREIEFEGHVYCFKGTKRIYDRSIHFYHCAEEKHYIRVHLQFNQPFLIEAFYSMDEVTIDAVRRAS